jgi:glucose-1-phosphate cytidylyltransferase
LSTDIQSWRITFADTGLNANVGQRLLSVRRYLEGEELFCANYGDALTDAPLPELVADFERQGKVAAFLSVRPRYSFHVVSRDPDGIVTDITDVHGTELWMNGGYFVFRQEIFDYIAEGEDLVAELFQPLIDDDQLLAHRYEGFWMPMDSLKDFQDLQAFVSSTSMCCSHVGDSGRRSTMMSRIAPRVQRTSLVSATGGTWKCIPRSVSLRWL